MGIMSPLLRSVATIVSGTEHSSIVFSPKKCFSFLCIFFPLISHVLRSGSIIFLHVTPLRMCMIPLGE